MFINIVGTTVKMYSGWEVRGCFEHGRPLDRSLSEEGQNALERHLVLNQNKKMFYLNLEEEKHT